MREKIIDYYSGFEGSPKIQFISVIDNEKLTIRVWIGYFDNIMEAINFEPPEWTGLALYYHLDEGWYEESPWKIPELDTIIQQFQKIDYKVFDKETKKVYEDIFNLLQKAKAEQKSVIIVYD